MVATTVGEVVDGPEDVGAAVEGALDAI